MSAGMRRKGRTMWAEAWLGIGILPADLDESGRGDMADFAVLSGWWMNHCPAEWPLK